jgi:hypothetical protein
MKIAAASDDGTRISGHVGRASADLDGSRVTHPERRH